MRKILSILLFLCIALMAKAEAFDFVVAADGSGDYKSIQEAINAVPDYRKKQTKIFVKSGVYKEKVVIAESKIDIKLVGQNRETTIIQYDDFARKKNIFGEEKGTSGSASFYVYSPDFRAENITFANTAGPVGQAVAMFVAGKRCVFLNCKFLGYQDTLYTFGKESKQLYKNCYIVGTVDFIFGSSTAYFDNCHIHCLSNGYITAASTPEGKEFGYVFRYCRLTAERGLEGIYLGRPWRPYAKTVFLDCTMGKFIVPTGWHNWGDPSKEQTTYYGEANNEDYDGHAIDMTQRASWSHTVNPEDYELEHVLADTERPDWFVTF